MTEGFAMRFVLHALAVSFIIATREAHKWVEIDSRPSHNNFAPAFVIAPPPFLP